MRSAKNFHPEPNYVAAKSFLVAMAVGAIASGQVILSLVDVRIDQVSVVVQSLAATAQALVVAPDAAELHPQPIVGSTADLRADDPLAVAANESSTNPNVLESAGPPTKVSPNDASVKVATQPSAAAAPLENKTINNHRVARHTEPRVARGGYGAWGWGGSGSHL
jgi:hypothetical protein